MVVRGDRLSKSMSAYLIERIEQHPLIDVHLETHLTGLHATQDPGGVIAQLSRRYLSHGYDRSTSVALRAVS
jgi:hypothetical protein